MYISISFSTYQIRLSASSSSNGPSIITTDKLSKNQGKTLPRNENPPTTNSDNLTSNMSTNTTNPSSSIMTDRNVLPTQESIGRHIRGLGSASLECSPGGNSFVPLPSRNNRTDEDPHYDSDQDEPRHDGDDDDYDEDDINAFRDTIMGGTDTSSVHGVRTGRNGMIFERPPPQVLNPRTPATYSSSSITSMSNSAASTSTLTQGNDILN